MLAPERISSTMRTPVLLVAITIVGLLAAVWLLWPTQQAAALPEWGVHAGGDCSACHVHPDRFACPDCHKPAQANLACGRLDGCHTGTTSPTEFCWNCHIQENSHVDALTKGGDERGGTVPLCTACHGDAHGFPAGCRGCHSVATHNTHTGQASVFDTLAQVDLTACGACHPGKNPHGPQQIDCLVCHPAKHTPETRATLQCATCHPLQPHDGLDCIDCHIGLDSIEDTSTQHNIEIRIPDCRDCHGLELHPGAVNCGTCHGANIQHETLPTIPGLTVCLTCHPAQAEHAGGAPCTSCHTDTVHSTTPQTPAPQFSGCFQCHPRQSTAGNCFECHPREGAHDFDRVQRPCGGCHNQEFHAGTIPCGGCHVMDHHDNRLVITRDECEDCHELELHPGTDECEDCHGQTNVHKAEPFIPGFDVCLTCHPAQAEHAGGAPCTSCHTDTVHSTTPQTPAPQFSGCFQCHPRQSTAGNCFECHPREGAHDFDRVQRPCGDCHNQQFHAGTVACAQCHALDHHDNRLVVTKDDCRDCHALALHPGAVNCDTCHGEGNQHKSMPTVPSLDICLDCHPLARGNCLGRCHGSQIHESNPSVPFCTGCHAQRIHADSVTCTRCHQVNDHHREAFSVRECQACHNQNYHAGGVACANCHLPVHGATAVPGESSCFNCHRVAHASRDCLVCHTALRVHHRITERALKIIRVPKRLATALERSLDAQIPDLRGISPDGLPIPATEGAATIAPKRPLIERLPLTGLSTIDIVFPVVLILALIAVAMLALSARERTKRGQDDDTANP
ncbi:MAG: hypothetical protein KGZ93_09685 [Actinobacteria bacterium]|nr:hypothetical protein [Actinomycetota bacterium]